MQTLERAQQEFWADTYRGRSIAVLGQSQGWLVYLDHMLKHGKVFATFETAVGWLKREIDLSARRRMH